MDTQQQYEKVQQFVKQQYSEIRSRNIPVIKSLSGGYIIGSYKVQPLDEGWQISAKNGNPLYCMKQRRTAIVMAALIDAKKYKHAQKAYALDSRYDIFLNDYKLYSARSEQNPSNIIYKDRFNRVDGELESLNRQINELEKTANLQ